MNSFNENMILRDNSGRFVGRASGAPVTSLAPRHQHSANVLDDPWAEPGRGDEPPVRYTPSKRCLRRRIKASASVSEDLSISGNEPAERSSGEEGAPEVRQGLRTPPLKAVGTQSDDASWA